MIEYLPGWGVKSSHSKGLQDLVQACHPELVSGSIQIVRP